MGLSGISFWEVLVILLVVLVVFGSKRLGSIGSDLGAAIRDFRKAISDEPTGEPRSGSSAPRSEAPPKQDGSAHTGS